jgi:hypothetical protein
MDMGQDSFGRVVIDLGTWGITADYKELFVRRAS